MIFEAVAPCRDLIRFRGWWCRRPNLKSTRTLEDVVVRFVLGSGGFGPFQSPRRSQSSLANTLEVGQLRWPDFVPPGDERVASRAHSRLSFGRCLSSCPSQTSTEKLANAELRSEAPAASNFALAARRTIAGSTAMSLSRDSDGQRARTRSDLTAFGYACAKFVDFPRLACRRCPIRSTVPGTFALKRICNRRSDREPMSCLRIRLHVDDTLVLRIGQGQVPPSGRSGNRGSMCVDDRPFGGPDSAGRSCNVHVYSLRPVRRFTSRCDRT